MSRGGLSGLLRRRMSESGHEPGSSIAVAELQRVLLPYHLCRATLELATKAEYDLAILHLLSEEMEIDEAELGAAVARELESPEPGLGFLRDFAASRVRVPRGTNGTAVEPAPQGPPATAPPGPAGPSARRDASSPCWKCGVDLPNVQGVRFCPSCGADQEAARCRECGEPRRPGWDFCPFCGTRTTGGPEPATE